jgi:hypothetical protein
MIDYGQPCTVARGAEVFGERWTPLAVRELLCGSTRFNDIRRGVPQILSTRIVESTALALTEVRTGDRDADEAMAERAVRAVRVRGPCLDVKALWGWLGRSAVAATRSACRAAAAS